VTFLDASKRALRKEPIYPAEVDGKELLLTLQQKDLVVLYEEHADEIQWRDANWMAQHVYSIKSFDRLGAIRMVLHKRSNANPNFPKLYPTGTTYTKKVNTFRGQLVKLDVLGNILRAK